MRIGQSAASLLSNCRLLLGCYEKEEKMGAKVGREVRGREERGRRGKERETTRQGWKEGRGKNERRGTSWPFLSLGSRSVQIKIRERAKLGRLSSPSSNTGSGEWFMRWTSVLFSTILNGSVFLVGRGPSKLQYNRDSDSELHRAERETRLLSDHSVILSTPISAPRFLAQTPSDASMY